MASIRDRLDRLERKARPVHEPDPHYEVLMDLLLREMNRQQVISEGGDPPPLPEPTPEELAVELDANECYLEWLAGRRQSDQRPEVLAGIDEEVAETRQEIEELKAKLQKGADDEG